jgi:hypothetical protein
LPAQDRSWTDRRHTYGMGPTAAEDWYRDVLVAAEHEGARDYFVTLGEPLHANVTGAGAYVVLPASMRFTVRGKEVTQSGALLVPTRPSDPEDGNHHCRRLTDRRSAAALRPADCVLSSTRTSTVAYPTPASVPRHDPVTEHLVPAPASHPRRAPSPSPFLISRLAHRRSEIARIERRRSRPARRYCRR